MQFPAASPGLVAAVRDEDAASPAARARADGYRANDLHPRGPPQVVLAVADAGIRPPPAAAALAGVARSGGPAVRSET
ncbi:MAG TPA: hypothetical protein VK162_12825 [Streptosporangiaceae bacterium]|nr:hypothetical protein [Streptosporangiaceae bacterium]